MQFNFEAIGTQWSIEVLSETKFLDKNKLKGDILNCIDSFDKLYSRFRKDSFVYELYQNHSPRPIPKYFSEILKDYRILYEASDGLFTPLIGSTLSDAGYDIDYTLKPKAQISKPPNWESSLSIDKTKVKLKTRTLLDFGAGGKGFLVDLVREILDSYRLSSYIIDASGDILYKGKNLIQVGLEHPNDPTSIIGQIEISNTSICASSGNRRKWDKYHHTLNPNTLESPTEVIATWVISSKAFIADSLATCLMLDPNFEKYKRHYNYEALLLYKDYKVKKTTGFNCTLY